MRDSALLAEVVRVVRSAAKVRPEVLVTGESRLVEDVGIDSLDLVNISLQVGDHFGVEIDPDLLPGLVTVGAIAAYVADRQDASAA